MTRRVVVRGIVPVVVVLAWAAAPVAGQEPAPRRLSLEEAVRLAEDASETIGIARAGVEIARGEQRQARSEYFPQLSGTASYTRTLETQFAALASDDENGAGGGPPAPTSCPLFAPNPGLPIEQRVDSLERALDCAVALDPFAGFSDLPFGQPNEWSFGLALTQNLFTGGRLGAQGRIAAANRRSAEVELTAQQAQLVLDVTTAYYDAALSDRLLSIAEASLEQSERTLQDVRLARQVGTQPEFELLRAEVTRDNQRPVVLQRRTARELAYLRLAQLLNLSLDAPLVLTTSLGDTTAAGGPPAMPIAAVAEAVPDTAVERRAPVQQAAANVAASEGRLTIARAQRLPSLVLSSQYAKVNFPEDPLPSGRFLTDWTVGVTLRLPLFTGGRLSADRAVARANVEQARLRLRQMEELARYDTRSALATVEEAEARWAASNGTVRQAARAYQIAEIRYREGISTQTELSDSRLQLQEAQANRAQAARDLQIARVRVALLRDLPLGGTGVNGTSTSPAAGFGGNATPAPAPAPPAGGGTTPGVRTAGR